MFVFAFLATLFCCCSTTSWKTSIQHEHIKLPLTGTQAQDWRIDSPKLKVQLSATVPGDVYLDLLRAGEINDPYYRFNDVKYRWIGQTNWTYSTKFEVTNEILTHKRVQLWMDGLDTVATIRVNGAIVGHTDNMFRRYGLDIKDFIKLGNQNNLSVEFESSVTYAAKRAAAYPYDVPPDCPSPEQHGECNYNFIRKEAAAFSWDWGPSFPTVGIWKNISLVAFSSAVIWDSSLTTNKDSNGKWMVEGSVRFIMGSQASTNMGTLTVSLPDLVTHSDHVQLYNTHTDHKFAFEVDKDIELWWPNGHGAQKLYVVDIVYHDTSGEMSQRTARVGFRTVELVQEKITGSPGLSFYFRINDVPIFMKGSNWIPADSFQNRLTETYLRRLLSSASEAHMNMLRVWGGGVYESEMFYNLADELGIMLWHDFMFACALYPTDLAFRENVAFEIMDQVRRLRHHPSIAIWAGNNENEIALASYRGKDTWNRYHDDYIALYIYTIHQVLEVEDPNRPFVPSSPSNGIETESEDWAAVNCFDEHYGDIHFYDYNTDSWNWTTSPIPRFTSEYGLESWCSAETLASVSEPSQDWTPLSNFSNHRQHHPYGNSEMADEISVHMKPVPDPNTTQGFQDYIYQTQINQAMGIKTWAELYRRSQSDLTGDRGHTMGSLYWQLNDIWQAPSWASIEFGGKWKMLHYYSKNFYSPQLLSPYVDAGILKISYIDDSINAKIVSDKKTPQNKMMNNKKSDNTNINEHNAVYRMKMDQPAEEDEQMIMKLSVLSWNNLVPLLNLTTSFNRPQKAATVVYQTQLSSLLNKAGCPSIKHCVLMVKLDKPAGISASNWLAPIYFKDAVGLMQPKLMVTNVKLMDKKTISMQVTTDAPAAFVWLDAWGYKGRFSDNGFLLAEPTRTIQFYAWDDIMDVNKFKQRLSVKSLMDIYT